MTSTPAKVSATARAAHPPLPRTRGEGVRFYLHQRYEPGMVVPTAAQMRRRRLALLRQKLLVDTLAWVCENERWLQCTSLELDFDAAACWLHPLNITERWPGIRAAPNERAIKRLLVMLNRLGPRKKLDAVAGQILARMNRVEWAPEHAVKILGGLGFRVGRFNDPHWITDHFSPEAILTLTTPTATAAPKARRL